MPKLVFAKQEAFAQAMARGMSHVEAEVAAGYIRRGKGPALLKDKDVDARITELAQTFPWSGSPDVGPVIEALVKTAQAVDIKTPAGARMAADLWSKVAELKQLLPAPRPLAAPPRPAMTAQQWSEKYKPKS